MLDSKVLLEKSVKHFPRWSDIRKRCYTSNGGNLLSSISDEVECIQGDIDEYVKGYFIPYYEDKTEIIPAFIYKANIGITEGHIELISPQLDLADSINSFYTTDSAFYDEGFIFVKNEADSMTYSVDGTVLKASLERIHVWNIYDEFATFVGIQRYENESNSDLYDRIIFTSNRVINSSEDGLRNAITSSLSNLIPELNDEDIIFERPTQENLAEEYDEENTILDHLTDVNRDVLNHKNWDLDKWSNDFKRIDYIPHFWDDYLSDYVNGIGYGDDLKVELLDGSSETDATISFYEKSEDVVSKYIGKGDIEENLTLTLKKYNNSIKPYTSRYKVTASEASEIVTDERLTDITMEFSERLTGVHTKNIEDVIIDSVNVTSKSPGDLSNGKYYRLKFTPKDKYGDAMISECKIVEKATNKETSLLSGQGSFYMKSTNGPLVNGKVKISATNISDFSSTDNIVKTGTGLTVSNISRPAYLNLDIRKYASEQLSILYNCETTKIPQSHISMQNFFYNKENGMYLSDNLDMEKEFKISINANKVSFNIPTGQCAVYAIVDGENVFSGIPPMGNNGYEFSTKEYSSPRNIEISIVGLGSTPITISDVEYSKFSVEASVDKGVLIASGEAFLLPSANASNLNIKIQAFTQYSPIIKTVFIGYPLDSDDVYVTDLISGAEGKYIKIDTNCLVTMYSSDSPFGYCDESDPNISVIQNYSSAKIFESTSDSSLIELDLSMYDSINNISIDNGSYAPESYGNMTRHFIVLEKGQKVSTIVIDGSYTNTIKRMTLNNIFKAIEPSYTPYTYRDDAGEWTDGYKVYVSKMKKGFILVNSILDEKFIEISRESIGLPPGVEITKVKALNVPASLQTVFQTNEGEQENVLIGSTIDKMFDRFYIYPKNSDIYVANNEYVSYLKSEKDIQIVNTFNNGYISNKLYAYSVESSDSNIDVHFDNNKDWCLSKNTLRINVKNFEDFNVTTKTVSDVVGLNNVVQLKDTYITENKERIVLDEYIVENGKNFEVIYKRDITNESYCYSEYISISNSNFSKLKYSHISDIFEIELQQYNADRDEYVTKKVSSEDYELKAAEGIIKWTNSEIKDKYDTAYISYAREKAVAVKYDVDYLYKKVNYPIDAYNKIGEVKVAGLDDGSKIDLNNPFLGDAELEKEISMLNKKKDVIYISSSNPNVYAQKDGDIISFKKMSENTALAIHSGWYYMYGKEYYMFTTDQSDNVINDEFTTVVEADKRNDVLYLHKDTYNYVKNSKMTLNALAGTYAVNNFNNLKRFKGSSFANEITACDSYNHWRTYGMDLGLKAGLNGLGLNFSAEDGKTSYGVLEITGYLSDYSGISFYNPNSLRVCIGIEEKSDSIHLVDSVNIKSLFEITQKQGNINYAYISKENNLKYYLVVFGSGVIDDIIIQNGEDFTFDLHTKNITTLGLDIKESVNHGVVTRFTFDNSKGSKNNGAEINRDGYIINASNIDWDITKIKSFKTREDWFTQCSLSNVNIKYITDTDVALKTDEYNGKLVTAPIYLGNTDVINKIIYKINDIPVNEMTGFTTTVYQGQSVDGSFIECRQELNNTLNYNCIKENVYPYIKLAIDIPRYKTIKSIDIFVEYKSTESNAPRQQIEAGGCYLSPVFDAHYSAKYRVKAVNIEDCKGDFKISIRASRENSNMTVWTDWHDIELNTSNNLVGEEVFNNYRYFQVKIVLNDIDAKVKINSIELEVDK